MDSIAYLTVRVILLTQLFTVLCFVQGKPRFTREPPSVIYVSSGGTARLVWDYNVENRTELFDPYSPEWSFYNTSGSKVRIVVEDGFNKWKFVIHKDCPTRLRGRVSKESTATLVISNVTIADSGIYGCDLMLLTGSPIRSRVHLIVTVPVETTNVSVSDIKATSAVIKWLSPLDGSRSAIIEYKIQINTIPSREIIIKTTSLVIKNLKENTKYSVEVYARNAAGYGKAKYTVFTTVKRRKSVVPTPRSPQKITCGLPTSFYQGGTFAIIHLSTTSVFVISLIILILYIFVRFKRNSKKDNRDEVTRSSPPVLFRAANEDTDDITSTEHSSNKDGLIVGNASKLYRKEDNKNIPEHSASAFDTGNTAQDGSERDVQQSSTHQDYQVLSNEALPSNRQDYQSLRKFREPSVTAIVPNLSPSKYEALDFKNYPQISEYQKLHLYANIEDKK